MQLSVSQNDGQDPFSEFTRKADDRNRQELSWLRSQLLLPDDTAQLREEVRAKLALDRAMVVEAGNRWISAGGHQETCANLSRLAEDLHDTGYYACAIEMVERYAELPVSVFDAFPDNFEKRFPLAHLHPSFEFFCPCDIALVYKLILIYANVVERQKRGLSSEAFLMDLCANAPLRYAVDVPTAVAATLTDCVLFAQPEPGEDRKLLLPNVFGGDLQPKSPPYRQADGAAQRTPSRLSHVLARQVLEGGHPHIPDELQSDVALIVDHYEAVEADMAALQPGDLAVWRRGAGLEHVLFVRDTVSDTHLLALEMVPGGTAEGFVSRCLPRSGPEGARATVLRPKCRADPPDITRGALEVQPSAPATPAGPPAPAVQPPSGPPSAPSIVVILVSVSLSSIAVGSVMPAFPVLGRSLGMPGNVYALTFALVPLGRLACATPSAAWASQHGEAMLQVAALASSASLMSCSALATPGQFAAAMLVLGGAGGVALSGIMASVARASEAGDRARPFALFRTANLLGEFSGAVGSGAVATRYGLRGVFALAGSLMALSAVPFCVAPRRPDPPPSDRAPFGAKTYAALLSDRALQVALLVQLLCTFAQKGMHQALLPQLCMRKFGMGVPQLGAVYAAGLAASGLASAPTGLLADWLGPRLSVCGGMGLMSGMALALPGLASRAQVIAAYVTYLVGSNCALIGLTPHFLDLYHDDPQAQSRCLALQRNVMYVGDLIGTPLLGGVGALNFFGGCSLHSCMLLAGGAVFGLCADGGMRVSKPRKAL